MLTMTDQLKLILLLVSYIISLSPLIIQGGSHVRCEFTSSYVIHPKVYNGSEYLNICRVTDITRSVNIYTIYECSADPNTPIVRKRSDVSLRSNVTEILLSAIPLAIFLMQSLHH